MDEGAVSSKLVDAGKGEVFGEGNGEIEGKFAGTVEGTGSLIGKVAIDGDTDSIDESNGVTSATGKGGGVAATLSSAVS